MSFVQHLREERNKLLLASLSSAIGFFLALLANSAVDQFRERKVYQLMLSSVRIEAAANAEILQTGFLVHFEKGIVLQQFGTSAAAQALASTSFLRFSNSEEVARISDYTRQLSLANRYREMVEGLRKSEGTEDFAQHVVNSWRLNLERCGQAISLVSAGP